MIAPRIDTSRVNLYNEGCTTVFAYPGDPRFSYCLYVPPADPAAPPPGLIVAVHDSIRTINHCRDLFAGLGARQRQVVLAPLFPADVLGDGNVDGYKYLIEGDVRYDLVLNGMIDLVAKTTGCDASRFCLFGFSGGGHFAHRFFYLHPERLAAVSIGAPGVVTLLDRERDFWVGVRNFEALFGKRLDIEAMRATPVHMVIGAEDKQTWEITIRPGNAWYMEGADLAGPDRLARLRALKASFEAAGIAVRHDAVPGAAHRMEPMVPAVEDFFAETLSSGTTVAGTTATRRLG